MTFAVNVVAPFLLTELLTDKLAARAPSRIITVSSGGMYTQRMHTDDLQNAHGEFNGATAYARSKRAQMLLTEVWARRLADRGIIAHAMHPGWADTPGISASLPRFYRASRPLLRSPQQGADTIVWLGAADEAAASSGGFWHDRRRRPTSLLPWTRETAADRCAVWGECVRLAADAPQRLTPSRRRELGNGAHLRPAEPLGPLRRRPCPGRRGGHGGRGRGRAAGAVRP